MRAEANRLARWGETPSSLEIFLSQMRERRTNIVRDLRMIIDHQWYTGIVGEF